MWDAKVQGEMTAGAGSKGSKVSLGPRGVLTRAAYLLVNAQLLARCCNFWKLLWRTPFQPTSATLPHTYPPPRPACPPQLDTVQAVSREPFIQASVQSALIREHFKMTLLTPARMDDDVDEQEVRWG